jgi:uncharacterized protein
MNERKIRIVAGDVSVRATLNASSTCDAFWEALPIDGRAQTWGDEIYFSIPVEAVEDAAWSAETVELGAVGYWPPGKALCLFFGPTPMSRGAEIRPASAVNVMGLMDGDPRVLKKVRDGARVTITRD